MGVLSYADDITLICPSIWGLNKMLKICNTLSKNTIILFNKKTTCIKFGDLILLLLLLLVRLITRISQPAE